jgi:sugar phosphate isomerase/epimerase
MKHTRRQFLAAVGAFPVVAAGRATVLDASHLGANTAITGYGMMQSIRLLRKLGFSVIEIQAMGVPEAMPGKFPGFEFDRIPASERAAIREALKGLQRITCHLPYNGLEYFSSNAEIAAAAVKRVDIAIEGSAYFGATMAVLHPKPGPGYTYEQQRPVMVERFRRWGDLAQKNGLRIALETGFPMSVPQFVSLVREVDHPAIGATLDVGHQARYAELAHIRPEDRAKPESIRAYNDVNLRIVNELDSKLFHLHIHDIVPSTWKEHVPLGTGFVDYPRLISALRRIGFSGSLILEIGAPPEEMESDLRSAKQQMTRYLA